MVERLLSSLSVARERFGGDSEVIVVDSSEPHDAEPITLACGRWRALYLRADNSVAHKRNIGVRRATGDVVFFIDSDCEADPAVLKEHWAVHATGEQGVAGALGVTEWGGPKANVWRVLDFSPSFGAAFKFAEWLREAPWGTCTNLSVRRDALLEIGGFDETLPLRVYGEDVDFGLRLNKAGYLLRCAPRARVSHSRETVRGIFAAARKMFTTGRADVHLGERHPERIAAEFPSPALTAIVLFALEAVRLPAGRPPWTLILPVFWLCLCVFMQAVLSAAREGGGLRSVPQRAAAASLEVAFDLGRLMEAVRRGRVSRAWTKFVYVKEQFAAERERRIIQAWSALLSLLALLVAGG